MTDPEASTELLTFFKALADETRLKIVGVLAQRPCSGEQLAAIVELNPATISHHLQKLMNAGLVTVEPQGHAKIYHLRMDTIHALAERLLAEKAPVPASAPAPESLLPQTWSESALAQAADSLDLDAFDRKVLKDFLRRDGSLKEIPAQYKKQLAVLRYIVKEFAPGQQYAEKQVNEVIARFHPDTASLRRAMIDTQLMQRANGKYWRL
jgi:DNA-binding transcriptional ArsR family regulator